MSSMSMTTDGIFQFGEFQLDVRSRSLRRDKAIVALNSRAFDVLVYFAQNSGKVLTREELIKNVWAESFVDESSLAQSISVLRRALSEKPGDNSYIVTLPGRGYQFVAPVRVVTSEGGNPPTQAAAASDSNSKGLLFQKHTIQTSVISQEKHELNPPDYRNRAWTKGMAVAAIFVVSAAIAGSMWYWRSYRAPKLTEK